MSGAPQIASPFVNPPPGYSASGKVLVPAFYEKNLTTGLPTGRLFDEGGNDLSVVTATTDAVTGVIELTANGAAIPSVGPSFTWANRPAASAMAGDTIRITNVGPSGCGSLWISNGTRWLPLNGQQLLSAKRTGTAASPLASVATVDKLSLPAGDMVTSGSIVLPADLLSAGMSLHVEGRFRHAGTGGTWSAGFRLGTLNSGSDNSCCATTGSATDDQTGWVFQEIMVLSSGSYASLYNTAPQGVAAAAISTRNTNFDTTVAMYLAPYASSVNAADTVQLIAYEVWLKG